MKSRRKFLKTAGVAAASSVVINPKLSAQTTSEETVSATIPTHQQEIMETGIPEGYTQNQIESYFIQNAGSDYMVDVVKQLDIDYIAANSGSTFRGFQESVTVYGKNKKPEFLTCLHEETAAGMAHGYAKIANKPMGVACHGTVGLQHASMAIYNAYCDRVPMIIFAGNHMEASDRRPGAEWAHSALDCVKIIRDYIKWDDIPLSLTHYAESIMRAYKIAMTPPMGPVAIVLDGHLQEMDMHGKLLPGIPKFTAPVPPHGDTGALREAARILVNAENPVIVAGRVARTSTGMQNLIELAEALQAPVTEYRNQRMNFPNNHYLSQSGGGVLQQADVILGLEMMDFWDTINTMRDLAHRTTTRVIKDDVKLLTLGTEEMFMKSNYQNFQRYQPVDLSISGDAETSLPYLTEEIKKLMPRSRRSHLREKQNNFSNSHQQSLNQARRNAAIGWNNRPISLNRVSIELWNEIKERDWSFVSGTPPSSRLWTMDRHYHQIGGSGGFGVGYVLPASVGAALANREHGRFSVAIQPDGDLLYAPGAIWTAAHHKIPILWVMHNNRAYHREVMHLQRMANRRQRGADGSAAKIGNVFENPFINFAALANSFGVYSEGPITDPDELGPALKRAAAVVDSGLPALVDVVCQPDPI